MNLRLVMAGASLAQAFQFGLQEKAHLLVDRGWIPPAWLPMLVMLRCLWLWPLFWSDQRSGLPAWHQPDSCSRSFYVHGVTAHWFLCRQAFYERSRHHRWIVLGMNWSLVVFAGASTLGKSLSAALILPTRADTLLFFFKAKLIVIYVAGLFNLRASRALHTLSAELRTIGPRSALAEAMYLERARQPLDLLVRSRLRSLAELLHAAAGLQPNIVSDG